MSAPVQPEGEAAPRRVGRYRLVRHLATGGMAEIWLAVVEARAAGEPERVVIKVIAPGRTHDREFVQMFLDEARLAATLCHPHIARLYEVGRDGDTYFHAVEHVHGTDARALLARAVAQQVVLPLAATVGIGSAVAAALHYAHERRGATGEPLHIVHRDVTPANIMLGWDGAVKLIDFGVALAAGRAARTKTGVVKGKLAYMSPEQCRGQRVDRRTDVFALGVVLYELSTRRRAFRFDSDYETMERIVRGNLAPPGQVVPGYPPALERIVLRALATDADARYQTAAELAAALDDFRRGHDLGDGAAAVAGLLRELFGEPPPPIEEAAPPPVERPSATLTATSSAASGPSSSSSAAGPSLAAMLQAAAEPGPTAKHEPVVPAGPRAWRRGVVAGLAAVVVVATVVVGVVALGGGAERRPAPAPGAAPGLDPGHAAGPHPAPGPDPRPTPAPAPEPTPASAEAPAPAPAQVTVRITSQPASAEVVLDGVVRGRTPFTHQLPRGERAYLVEVRRAGHLPAHQQIVPDRDLDLTFTLERRVDAPTAPPTSAAAVPAAAEAAAAEVDAGAPPVDLSSGRF